jgi:adenine phosphoribosyltransferase
VVSGADVTVTGDSGTEIAQLIADRVIDVPDFPLPGVVFKDISPLLADPAAFKAVVDALADPRGAGAFDVVAGVEARGFVLAAAVAYAAGTGVVPVRKAGKLPRQVHAATYELEYGSATLEVHADAFTPGQRVLVVDDVLATGGTAEAAASLVDRAGGVLVGLAVLLELEFLHGRRRLADRRVHALLRA